MTIIKEIYKGDEQRKPRCVIRTNTYSSTLAHINMLFDLAMADFPALNPEHVRVIHYAGQRYKGTFGIEFTPIGDVPAEYFEIPELEFTL